MLRQLASHICVFIAYRWFCRFVYYKSHQQQIRDHTVDKRVSWFCSFGFMLCKLHNINGRHINSSVRKFCWLLSRKSNSVITPLWRVHTFPRLHTQQVSQTVTPSHSLLFCTRVSSLYTYNRTISRRTRIEG